MGVSLSIDFMTNQLLMAHRVEQTEKPPLSAYMEERPPPPLPGRVTSPCLSSGLLFTLGLLLDRTDGFNLSITRTSFCRAVSCGGSWEQWWLMGAVVAH